MTIFEASSKLFGWFREHDSFILEEDFQSLILISEEKERDSACVTSALNHLKEVGLIKSENLNGREIWLLNKSLSQFEQTVELSAETCLEISETINNFCDLIEDKTDYCDCTNITEKDVRNLIIMYEQTRRVAQENMKNDLT